MAFENQFLLDTLRDYSFAGYHNDITSYVQKASCQHGLLAVYDCIGNAAYLELTLSNADGDFSLENTSAKYYGKIRFGTLVRWRKKSASSAWTNLTTLRIVGIVPNYAADGNHTLTLKCSDILQDFLNQDYIPPLQTNVRIDEALTALHESRAAIWPYESYYQFIGHTSIGDGKAPFYGLDWIDFEAGETTLPYLGDNLDRGQGVKVQQYLKDAVGAELYGIYYFDPRSEVFKFFSRYHAADTASSWIIQDTLFQPPQYSYGRDLVNDLAISYYPRAVGAEHSVLWNSDSLPMTLPARSTKRFTIKYRDPDFPNASVGALTVEDIQKGVDIIANTAADGSGDDKTSLIDITLKKGAGSSEVILSNRKRGNASYITTFQLRGTPLTSYNKETAYGYNDTSIYGSGSDESSGNGRKSGFETLYAVSDGDFAQAYADFRVNANGQPQQALERLSIVINANDTTNQNKMLASSIGTVITVIDSRNSHQLDYMIVAEMHSIEAMQEQHNATYTLRPVNRGELFVVGTSSLDSGDIFAF